MNKTATNSELAYSNYLEFVEARLRATNFRAAEKLRRLDELAEIIFLAKHNYQKDLKREAI